MSCNDSHYFIGISLWFLQQFCISFVKSKHMKRNFTNDTNELHRIVNSWIVTVHPSVQWKPICTMCPFLFRVLRTWHPMNSSPGVSGKSKDTYPTGAPIFSGIHVANLLFYFVCIIFWLFVVYICFPCVVFVPGLHSFAVC